jgi:membrane protein
LAKWPGLALELGSLLGAKLNAEIEHQTARESTVGPPKPLGSRGAKMPDTIRAAQA